MINIPLAKVFSRHPPLAQVLQNPLAQVFSRFSIFTSSTGNRWNKSPDLFRLSARLQTCLQGILDLPLAKVLGSHTNIASFAGFCWKSRSKRKCCKTTKAKSKPRILMGQKGTTIDSAISQHLNFFKTQKMLNKLKKIGWKWFGTRSQKKPLLTPVKNAQGAVVLVDEIMLEHLQSKAPNPTQASLDAMLAKVTYVKMLEGGVYKDKALGKKILLETSDRQTIQALSAGLSILEDPRSFGHCMCLGDHALEFYHYSQRIATIGLHHGVSIRWDAWKYDAHLSDNLKLLYWLAAQGVPEPLLAFQRDQALTEEAEAAFSNWKAQMPDCLTIDENEWMSLQWDTPKYLQALQSAYPDGAQLALVLFAWFGSGNGPWSGYPSYEDLPLQLLLELPTAQLVAALSSTALSKEQLEGGARYFSSWYFCTQKSGDMALIPAELKAQLLAHSLDSSDTDRILRAKNAFYPQ